MTGRKQAEHVASIVHVTDLHWYAGPDGELKDIARDMALAELQQMLGAIEERLPARIQFDIAEGLNCADPNAVDAFMADLPRIVNNEHRRNVPVVVVHTGDAEAFGTAPGARCHAYALLDEVWDEVRAAGAAEIVQVYGNHDVWAGTFALLRPDFGHAVNQTALSTAAPEFGRDWPIDGVTVVPSEVGPDLEFIRVNTVRTELVRGGLFAFGRVDAHWPGRDWHAELTGLGPRENTIRIIVTHHPIHAFGGRVVADVGPDALSVVQMSLVRRTLQSALTRLRPKVSVRHGKVLAEAAREKGAHLFLAGHRHRLNPGRAASVDVASQQQAPLVDAGQLVAESPTQQIGYPPRAFPPPGSPVEEENSISVYRILRDERAQQLTVTRLRYVYTGSTGFSPGDPSFTEPLVLTGIPFANQSD